MRLPALLATAAVAAMSAAAYAQTVRAPNAAASQAADAAAPTGAQESHPNGNRETIIQILSAAAAANQQPGRVRGRTPMANPATHPPQGWNPATPRR